MRGIRVVLVVGLTLMVFGSLLHAGAKSLPRPARLATFDLDPLTQADMRYWNDERIDALPTPDSPEASSSATITTVGTEVAAPVVSGEEVSPSVRAPVRVARIERLQSLQDFESHEIGATSQFPNTTHGKIIAFATPTTGWVCSGTIVSSESESLVLTAAHCLVSDDGAKPLKIVFIPGYRNGDLRSGPLGVWEATKASFPQGYLAGGGEPNYEYDVGAFRVAPVNGMTIEDRVGARGYLFNAPATQVFQSFGYPAASPFDGEKLWTCQSQSGRRLDIAGGPDMVSMGCDMTQGSSGGGWIVDDEKINSVVSIGITTMPDVLWGPYFGSTAQNLWSTVGGGGSDPAPGPDPTEPVTHQMKVTLKLSGTLVATGRLTSVDGYRPCAAEALVGIVRKTRSGVKPLVGSKFTDGDGRYRIRIPKETRRGRYFAVSPEGSVDDLNLCSYAESTLRRY
jgi:V8-like Glu-specific endopeptidase